MMPFGLQLAMGLAKGVAKGGISLPGGPKRRRTRRGLTQKRKNDLLWLKNNVGRTAAANYLSNHSI